MTLTIQDITAALAGEGQHTQFKNNIEYDEHEKIICAVDPEIGFKAFIAIHNTSRGPALGGCRYRTDYKSDQDALTDVLRLSKGMTYKNAMADLDLGGGKAVIVGTPEHEKPTPDMMQALGRAVDSLDGLYVTAEDMNTSESDMEIVWKETKHVSGIALKKIAAEKFPEDFDTSTLPSANPSPYTAYGTLMGIKAAVHHKMGRDTLKGVKVAIKGACGSVGSELCRLLHQEGADLIISDWDRNEKMQARLAEIATQYNAKMVLSADIMKEESDVYAPCAKGAGINDQTVHELNTKIVAGCANNVLAETRHADVLRQRDILYAPDYVINAGGVICVAIQYLWLTHPEQYPIPTHEIAVEKAEKIYDVLIGIFQRADRKDRDTASIADQIACEKFCEKKPEAKAVAA